MIANCVFSLLKDVGDTAQHEYDVLKMLVLNNHAFECARLAVNVL